MGSSAWQDSCSWWAGAATALAYRRISRPVADLLGTAERLTDGDYGVKIEPDGPRLLRTLTTTFNEMAARFAASEDQGRRFLVTIVTSPPCWR